MLFFSFTHLNTVEWKNYIEQCWYYLLYKSSQRSDYHQGEKKENLQSRGWYLKQHPKLYFQELSSPSSTEFQLTLGSEMENSVFEAVIFECFASIRNELLHLLWRHIWKVLLAIQFQADDCSSRSVQLWALNHQNQWCNPKSVSNHCCSSTHALPLIF